MRSEQGRGLARKIDHDLTINQLIFDDPTLGSAPTCWSSTSVEIKKDTSCVGFGTSFPPFAHSYRADGKRAESRREFARFRDRASRKGAAVGIIRVSEKLKFRRPVLLVRYIVLQPAVIALTANIEPEIRVLIHAESEQLP